MKIMARREVENHYQTTGINIMTAFFLILACGLNRPGEWLSFHKKAV